MCDFGYTHTVGVYTVEVPAAGTVPCYTAALLGVAVHTPHVAAHTTAVRSPLVLDSTAVAEPVAVDGNTLLGSVGPPADLPIVAGGNKLVVSDLAVDFGYPGHNFAVDSDHNSAVDSVADSLTLLCGNKLVLTVGFQFAAAAAVCSCRLCGAGGRRGRPAGRAAPPAGRRRAAADGRWWRRRGLSRGGRGERARERPPPAHCCGSATGNCAQRLGMGGLLG